LLLAVGGCAVGMGKKYEVVHKDIDRGVFLFGGL